MEKNIIKLKFRHLFLFRHINNVSHSVKQQTVWPFIYSVHCILHRFTEWILLKDVCVCWHYNHSLTCEFFDLLCHQHKADRW